LAEDYLKYCVAAALCRCADDLEFFEGSKNEGLRDRLKAIVETPFKRLEYTEAISVLQKEMKAGRAKFENTDVTWGIDLDSEHERYLTEKVYKGPVVLINYPKDIKAFYMKLNADGKTVAAMDILVPRIGEIIGGSQREDSLEVLEERAKSVGLNPEDIKWYGELRQYGSVPHAGFGLGFERLVMLCSGVENIRDVIPFPRTPGNCRF
jgi:asparaginyl-tRNA synthetase